MLAAAPWDTGGDDAHCRPVWKEGWSHVFASSHPLWNSALLAEYEGAAVVPDLGCTREWGGIPVPSTHASLLLAREKIKHDRAWEGASVSSPLQSHSPGYTHMPTKSTLLRLDTSAVTFFW